MSQIVEQQTHAYFIRTYEGWQGPFFHRPEAIAVCDITPQVLLTRQSRERLSAAILSALKEGDEARVKGLCESFTIKEIQ